MENTNTPQRRSALAIWAFVLSLIFFLPIVPLIGAILGIIALVLMKPGTSGKGLAIAAIPVGLVIGLIMQGIIAAVSIPAFINYMRRAKTAEAKLSIEQIASSARSFREANGTFPVAQTPWTPVDGCCTSAREHCLPSAVDWNTTPWTELGFSRTGKSYYQYRYVSDGQRATIEAQGDLDCDGKFSNFKRLLSADGHELSDIQKTDELE